MQSYIKEKTAIVYLAMDTESDDTYGRNSKNLLKQSLNKLYDNYNSEFKHDVIIFHEHNNAFSNHEQNLIRNNRPEIKFVLLDDTVWRPPTIIRSLYDNAIPCLWSKPEFPIGYRNMVRFHGILIYNILFNMGYDMYMRLDDDSVIHSKINYDIFKFLKTNNYQYGFRSYALEGGDVAKNFIEICYEYIKLFNIHNHWIDRFLLYGKIWHTDFHNRIGFYNNFSITDLHFWMREDVQNFLHYIDDSGLIYLNRLGDLMIQTLTIQMFMQRNMVHQFQDWSYEHATTVLPVQYQTEESTSDTSKDKEILYIGGYYPKIINQRYELDNNAYQWYNKYNKFSELSYQLIPSIQNTVAVDIDVAYCVISDNDDFMPNANHDIYYLGQFFNIEDVYHRIDDHLLNCETINDLKSFVYNKPFAFMWYNNNKHNNYAYKLYAINNAKICNFCEHSDCTAILLKNSSYILDGSKYDQNMIPNTSAELQNNYITQPHHNIDNHNPKTLITIIGSIRGNEDLWHTLYRNVQAVYNADIMLCISKTQKNINSSLYKKAKYIIEIPEYNNWIDYYKEHTNFNIDELKMIFSKGSHIGLAGGIDDYSGSGSIIFAFRHFLKNFCTDILSKYNRIILTRSDFFYAAPHPILDNNHIWIVEGENYNGITDRHHVFPTQYINEMLGVIEYMMTDHAKEKISHYHTPDPEFVLASSFDFFQINKLIQRFTRYQFTAASTDDTTRWKTKEFMLPGYQNLYIKYPDEYYTTLMNLKKYYNTEKFIISGAIT